MNQLAVTRDVQMSDQLHALTLSDLLAENARIWPDRTAFVCGDTRLTWPELDARVNRLSSALQKQGAGPGDRVLWLGQNCHRLFEGIFACARIGAQFCPANWRQSAAEMAFVVDDLRPEVVIWQAAEIGDRVRAAQGLVASPARWLCRDAEAGDAEAANTYEAFLDAARETPGPVTVDPDSPLLIMYTAAFGGRPNGAQLSHTTVMNQNMVLALTHRVTFETVFLNSGPLFHVGTMMTAMSTIAFGGTNVMLARVDPEEVCRLIERERVTRAFLMGETLDRMVEVNSGKRYDLRSLRTASHSPGWDAMVTIEEDRDRKLGSGYGQTELMGLVTWLTFGGSSQGRHGRPSPLNAVRIVDPDGAEVPAGETGEIVVRGGTVMTGYWNRPELTADRQAGRWHHTGDLGRREADGSLTFVGAKSRLIKSGAENIYPAEVETCIRLHEAVADCAVIGVPDARFLQNVKAIVVIKPDAMVSAADIADHCRTRIASYKKPKTVEFVDALPRNGAGVDYAALDARFGGGGYPGGTTRST